MPRRRPPSRPRQSEQRRQAAERSVGCLLTASACRQDRETARGSRLDWCATHCPPSKTGSSNDSNTAPNETLRELIHTEVTQAVAEAIETKRAVHCDADAKTRSTTECWSTPLFRIGGPMRPEAGWPFASGPGQDFCCSVRQAQQTQRGLAVAAGLRTQRQPGSMVVR